MKLIINADDFGISSIVNNAIVQAFEKNLISSTSIMTNMPCFEEACELITRSNLHRKVGIHLNLTEGYPITERMSFCNKFCADDGRYIGERNKLFWLTNDESKAVYEEFQAQINRLTSRGIIPTHIDSHHHYHTRWTISKEAIKIAHQNGINSIRLTRNCGHGIRGAKKLYKIVINKCLQKHGFSKVKYFGSVKDVMTINKPESYDIEIMVHPGFNEKGELIDLGDGEKLHTLIENIKALIPKANLSSYYGERI